MDSTAPRGRLNLLDDDYLVIVMFHLASLSSSAIRGLGSIPHSSFRDTLPGRLIVLETIQGHPAPFCNTFEYDALEQIRLLRTRIGRQVAD
jgi:hypothetical protein